MGYNKCTGRDEQEALRIRGLPNKVFALDDDALCWSNAKSEKSFLE